MGRTNGPRSSVFRKYFFAIFATVVVPLLIAGGSEVWFRYHDNRARLNDLLDAEARMAAVKIQDFLDEIRGQLAWAVQLPWSRDGGERRYLETLRLLRQAAAVESITLIDATGKERLFVSRIGLNRMDDGRNHSSTPAVLGARSNRIWFGPVTFHDGSEPYMNVAIAGNRTAVGVVIAEINLKFIWEVIAAIRIGRTGQAFVLDAPGRLIAHPDISLVLRPDEATQRPLQILRAGIAPGIATLGKDLGQKDVLAAAAPIPGVEWTAVVKLPLEEAFAPLYAALWRTGMLLVAGAALSALFAYWLTGHIVGPIRVLEQGVARIEAGDFQYRIHLPSSDEFGRLAIRFNEMASELSLSKERSERINRLKRFLAPQVAELVDRTRGDHVLDTRRVEVVVVFCDLREFTAFSAHAEPDAVIGLLRAYYDAVERVVTTHEATLVSFSGDGIMVLVNAPVPCTTPELRAVSLATDIQKSVQAILGPWREVEPRLGCGVGLAMGVATVGRIGTEARANYTAIGSVVNLASRLCAAAEDAEILADGVLAHAVGPSSILSEKGIFTLKGFDEPVLIFSLSGGEEQLGVRGRSHEG